MIGIALLLGGFGLADFNHKTVMIGKDINE